MAWTTKRRDVIKALEDAEFRKLRDEGNHTIYFKQGYPLALIPWTP